MNHYSSILKKLYSVNTTFGIKLGLENVRRLNTLMGSPSNAFQSVHIAGTNGKGSVAAKVGKGLESRYPRVGLYTSPHISSFRERIRINRELISEEDAARTLSSIFALCEKENIPATFFEITTLLAFKHFAESKVDIAVIETGLGGRLDATNILSPLLSIITSIDFDHTEILGKTIEAIAQEKGGIIKPGVPIILGPSARCVPCPPTSKKIEVQGPFADADTENRAVAREALLYLNITENAIRKAVTTKLPCRLERISYQGKEILLDAAHNPNGLGRLFQDLNLPRDSVRVICGLSKTKDHAGCLDIIQKNARDIHLVDAPNGRCSPPDQLRQQLLKLGVSSSRIYPGNSVHQCIADSMALADASGQQILVCGTFFIMSEARKALGIEEPTDPFDLNER